MSNTRSGQQRQPVKTGQVEKIFFYFSLVLATVVTITAAVLSARVWVGKESNSNSSSNNNEDFITSLEATKSTIVAPPPTKKAWLQFGSRLAGPEVRNAEFGHCVCLSGDGKILAVGSPGYEPDQSYDSSGFGLLQVFRGGRSPDNNFDENFLWEEIGSGVIGDMKDGRLGTSCAMSQDGSHIVVGSPHADNSTGMVGVYKIEPTSQSLQLVGDFIRGEAAHDESGGSVSISSDGKIIAIGSAKSDRNGKDSGNVRVYVFQTDEGEWSQLGRGMFGSNELELAGWGISLSGDGSQIVIGSPGSNTLRGRASVYRLVDVQWMNVGDFVGTKAFDQLGGAVAMSSKGNVVAIGSPGGPGLVQTFRFSPSEQMWVSMGQDLRGKLSEEGFGHAIRLSSDGTTLVVGGTGGRGVVRIFQYNDGIWLQEFDDLVGEDNAEHFGSSVSISSAGNHIACGAPFAAASSPPQSIFGVGRVAIFQRLKAQ